MRAGRDLVDELIVGAAAAGATVLSRQTHELDRARNVATRARPRPPSAGASCATTIVARRRSMLDEAALVAGKDLRIEWRSKIAIGQLVPFSLLVLVLFAFALDPERGLLSRVSSGLYWVAVLFSTTLAVQRAFSIEAADGAAMRSGSRRLRPTSVFVGKAAAIGAQLLALEAVLGLGIVVLYSLDVAGGRSWPRPPSPRPSASPAPVPSTGRSLPVSVPGRPFSRCCSCRWWRPC